MKHRLILVFPLVMTVTGVSVAAAEPGTMLDGHFALLDRGDRGSHAGVDLSFNHFTELDFPDSFVRFELHGSHVTPSGFGGYAALPIHAAVGDETESAVGSPELGGLYVVELDADRRVVGRVGVILPLAEDDDVLINALGAFTRTVDLMQALPSTLVARASVSYVSRIGPVTCRLDAGVDVPVVDTDDDDEFELERDPFTHVNGAVGYDLGPASIAAELVNVIELAGDIETQHQIGASIRASAGTVRPFASVSTFLDQIWEDDVEEEDGMTTLNLFNDPIIVMAGIAVPFR